MLRLCNTWLTSLKHGVCLFENEGRQLHWNVQSAAQVVKGMKQGVTSDFKESGPANGIRPPLCLLTLNLNVLLATDSISELIQKLPNISAISFQLLQ